jgi:hypothetical protein
MSSRFLPLAPRRPVHLDSCELSMTYRLVSTCFFLVPVTALSNHAICRTFIDWMRSIIRFEPGPRGSLRDGKVNQTTKNEVVSALFRTVTRSSLTALSAKLSIRCSKTTDTFISFPLLKYRNLLIDLLIFNNFLNFLFETIGKFGIVR